MTKTQQLGLPYIDAKRAKWIAYCEMWLGSFFFKKIYILFEMQSYTHLYT